MMQQFEVEQIPDNVWMYAIRNCKKFSWNFLAVKIMLARLNLRLSMYSGNAGLLSDCCNELRNLLRKSSNIPNAQRDWQQIQNLSNQLNCTVQ